jgi:hypothetical protein
VAAYDSELQRIHSKGQEAKDIALNRLAWILYANRSLKVCELLDALSVETLSTSENVLDVNTLLECFSGLVVVEQGVVQFIHYTLQEYLSVEPFISLRAHLFEPVRCTFPKVPNCNPIPIDRGPHNCLKSCNRRNRCTYNYLNIPQL